MIGRRSNARYSSALQTGQGHVPALECHAPRAQFQALRAGFGAAGRMRASVSHWSARVTRVATSRWRYRSACLARSGLLAEDSCIAEKRCPCSLLYSMHAAGPSGQRWNEDEASGPGTGRCVRPIGGPCYVVAPLSCREMREMMPSISIDSSRVCCWTCFDSKISQWR